MRISVFALSAGSAILGMQSAQAVKLHSKKASSAQEKAALFGDFAETGCECICDEAYADDEAAMYNDFTEVDAACDIAELPDDEMVEALLAETEQANQDMSAINLIDNERNMHMVPAPPQPQQGA